MVGSECCAVEGLSWGHRACLRDDKDREASWHWQALETSCIGRTSVENHPGQNDKTASSMERSSI